MFFVLSKISYFFLSPITWFVILGIGAFVCKKRRWKRALQIGALLVFLIFTNKALLDYATYRVTQKYEKHTLPSEKVYETGVVLGGFSKGMNTETGQIVLSERGAERILEAAMLYKTGRVKRLLFTGDATSAKFSNGTDTAPLFLAMLERLGIPREAILLEQYALNTQENALLSQKLWRNAGIRDEDILLITSATHMERSLKWFEKVGVHPDYYPVRVYAKPGNLTWRDFYPDWSIAVQWDEVLREWAGRIVAR